MGLIDIPWLTDALKKRALRYLLQRYMGHFLAEKLTLEQLSIDLYDGTGCIKDLALDVEGLNEELVFLPFQFTDGCGISEINCSVPWSSLMTESCSLEIHGATFHLNFCSSKDHDDDHPLYESSYLSKSMMSSSMQMAEEIASDEKNNDGQFEGLEMMAQLIDSVLRRVKVVATDTTIIMKSACSSNNNPSASTSSPPSTSKSRSTGGSSVEFKIKYLRCEEDMLDPSISKDFKCNTPGNIDKLLTLEGVEVGINGRSVSRIGGKHLIKIKANQEKSDLQIFLGSPLLAILSSSELKSFFDVFSAPDPDKESPSHAYGSGRYGSKPMTEEHFFHLEHILQQDAQTVKQQQSHPHPGMHQQQNLLGTSPLAHRWSEASTADKQFHPLSESLILDYSGSSRSGRRSRTQSTMEANASAGNQFSCFIKIPGVYLCLLQKSDQSNLPSPTIPLIQVDFQKINSFLDDIVKDRNHVRLIAFPIHLDINKSSSINVIVGDAMVIEQSGGSKIPLFWSECNDKHMTAPKYRCEIRPSSSPAVMIEGHETTCITFDPTIRERLHEYMTDDNPEINCNQSLNSGTSNIMDFELKSRLLKVNLLFPIPDLRDEEEQDDLCPSSGLRSEAVMMVLEEVVITTNLKNTKAVFDDLKAILTEKDKEPVLFLQAKRNPVDQIEVLITQGPASVCVSDDHDPESYLSGDMEDSVYYSNLNEQEKTTAFLVKNKLINGGGRENESVIGPSDRKNSQAFLNQARSCTATQIEINIPTGEVALDQRQLDLIYNRFANDLVMWIPKERKKKSLPEQNATAPANVYKPCVSALAASTDSVESDSSFHSTEDATNATLIKNNCVVIVNLDEVSVSALGRITAEQKIKGQKVALGFVIGMEDEKKSVIFLNGEKASFHHGKDQVINNNVYNDVVSLVNLTVEINKVAKDFNKIKIAIGVEDAALYKTDVEIFKSFWDFINVTKEEVIGYVPPSITTELHISLLKGAVAIDSPETRPALISFDHVYMTSMVVEKNRETLLRIILEEGSIYFSKSMKQPSFISPQRTLRDYVCILDSGLTDLSIIIKDEGRIELKVSNNVINMRVCSDSLSALCNLIMHVASPSGSANSASSQESLEIPDPLFSESVLSETYRGLEDREEDLLKDAIDECSLEESDNLSLKSCDNCDAALRQAVDESGFWILGDDDVGAGITTSIEPVARKLTSDPIAIKENHFTSSRSRPLPEILKETTQRFLLEQLTIICNFYGGKDFNDEVYDSSLDLLREADKDSDDTSGPGKSGMNRKEGESAKGLRVTFKDDPECEPQVNLWESLNLVSGLEAGLPHKGSASHTSAAASKAGKSMAMEGGKGRQNDVCVQLYLSKIKSLFETFDPTFNVSWRFVFMVQDIEVKDKVSHSRINKMLYEYCNESMPRRNHVNMISVKATCKKNPDDNNDECDIRVSAKPLRINIDQDTLMFLIDFFTSISATERRNSMGSFMNQQTSSPANLSQTSLDKISAADTCSSNASRSAGVRVDGENDEEVDDAVSNMLPSVQSPKGSRKGSVSSVSKPPMLYVKTFVFSPDVPIRLDYHGKRLDFEKVSSGIVLIT